MKSAKVYIRTYGCQMNELDSQRMAALLVRHGYESVARPEEADVIVLNTCSVRANPENKVYSAVGTLKKLKKDRPGLILAVAGCVAQQEGRRLMQEEAAVDLVLGPDRWGDLPQLLARVEQGERVLALELDAGGSPPAAPHTHEEAPVTGTVEAGGGFVAIMTGCDNFCAFCVVPYTRGREKSRPVAAVLDETARLVSMGARQVTLLGQNVNSYRSERLGFCGLLERVAAVPGLRRVRFMSPHPKDWNEELSHLMASTPAVCKALHLPVQSGSDRILAAMNRRHTAADYLARVETLRALCPDVELTTDLIVGFPGETERDFEDTLSLMRRVEYASAFAFKYSPRPGTQAAKLPDDVPREVKDSRLTRLLDLQRALAVRRLDRQVGRALEVMVEGPHPRLRNRLCARTDTNFPVSIPLSDTLRPGDFLRVRVTGKDGGSLIGDSVVSTA